MRTQIEIKTQFIAALAAVMDEPLQHYGFLRKNSSLCYSRTQKTTEQQIAFAIEYLPKYQPGAELHIQPMLKIIMPPLTSLAMSMVDGEKTLLANAPEIIVNQPIEFTAPKGEHQRWFASGNDQMISACKAILLFVVDHVIPLLSEVREPSDLIRIYEMNDNRIMKQRHWHVFIAAAYKMSGQLDKSRQVVEEQFGSAGLRKRYASLFDSLDIK